MICIVLQIKAQTHFKPMLFEWISIRAAKSNALEDGMIKVYA